MMSREKQKQLEEAYLGAVYRLGFPGGNGGSFQPGGLNPEMDMLVQETGCQSWSFITACNPGSRVLSEQENNRRNSDLFFFLDRLGYPHFPAYSAGENWPAESGCVVICIDEEDAIRTARLYNQTAIVYGRYREPARLIFVGLN